MVPIPQDDSWFRDTGPTVRVTCVRVLRGRRARRAQGGRGIESCMQLVLPRRNRANDGCWVVGVCCPRLHCSSLLSFPASSTLEALLPILAPIPATLPPHLHPATLPQFIVKDGSSGQRRVAGVDWQFNAWGGEEGGLYHSWERDQAVAGRILEVRCVRVAGKAGRRGQGGGLRTGGGQAWEEL